MITVKGHYTDVNVDETYRIVLDEEDLSDLEHEEEPNQDEEVPPPKIGDIEIVTRKKVVPARDHA